MSADIDVYTLTVEADSPVTLHRNWQDASTTREPTNGTVEFSVIEGPGDGYTLTADGYEDKVVHVDSNTTVSMQEETDDEESDESFLRKAAEELTLLDERVTQLESTGGRDIDLDALADEVASRIDISGGKDIDLDALADDVASRIDRDSFAADVISRIDIDEIAGEAASRIDLDAIADRVETNSGNIDEELAEIRNARKRLSLAGEPNHVRTLFPGEHEDQGYHKHGGWGLVVTPKEDVVWRSATVNAEQSGTFLLEVFDMDFEWKEKYEVGDRLKSQEINLKNSGLNTLRPDIVLEEDETYFITRDSENPVDPEINLKRGARDVVWGEHDETHDVPIRINSAWQMGRGQPGTDEFEEFRNKNWHLILHNFRDLEFGFK